MNISFTMQDGTLSIPYDFLHLGLLIAFISIFLDRRLHPEGLVVVMASGWEFEGLGSKPRWLQATFDPRLPKNLTKIFPAL